jgi:hypothetical protein
MESQDYPVDGLPTPDPDYGPAEVIATQVEAFADNDDPIENAGIKNRLQLCVPGKPSGHRAARAIHEDGPRTAIRPDDRPRGSRVGPART